MSLLLPFNVWKQRLRDDCTRCDRLWGFNALDDECLRVLWQAGTEPSVRVHRRREEQGRGLGQAVCRVIEQEMEMVAT